MGAAKSLPTQFASIVDSDGNELLLDCLFSDTHEYESEVSEYPVESGSNIIDNVRPKPIVINIEAIVSNDPIGPMIAKRGGTGTNPDPTQAPLNANTPVADALAFLEKMYADRKPGKVRTSLRTYDKVVMKSLSIARNSEYNVETLKFTASFQQVQIVENRRFVRVSVPIAQSKTTTDKPAPDAPFANTRTVDTKNLLWFDPDVSNWRQIAVYDKKLQKWRLYRGTQEGEEHPAGGGTIITKSSDADQAFDSIRADGKHPVRNLKCLTEAEYVIVK